MQINLNPTEINDAIKVLLVQKGIDLQDKNVSFKFNNRRTKGGIFAVVSVENVAVVAPLEAGAAVLTQEPVQQVQVFDGPSFPQEAIINTVFTYEPTPGNTVEVKPLTTPEPVVETQPEPAPVVSSLFG